MMRCLLALVAATVAASQFVMTRTAIHRVLAAATLQFIVARSTQQRVFVIAAIEPAARHCAAA